MRDAMEFFDPFGPADGRSRADRQESPRDATSDGEKKAEARGPAPDETDPTRRWGSVTPARSFPVPGGAARARRSGASSATPPRTEPSVDTAAVDRVGAGASPVDPFEPFTLEATEARVPPGRSGGEAPTERPDGRPSPGVDEPPALFTRDRAVARLREVAAPALSRAMGLIAHHGHRIELSDDLEHPRSPALAVRFRPLVGPLRPSEAASRSERELRFVVEREGRRADDGLLPGPFRVAAVHSDGALDTRSGALTRVDVQELGAAWVTERLVEFIGDSLREA